MNNPVRMSAEQSQANRRLALRLGLVALFFVGFGFALVPLYDVLCQLMGISGKTRPDAALASQNTQVDVSRIIKVEFLSHTMPGVALEFKPEQFSMQVHPGEVVHTSYVVRNLTNKVFVAQAVPSVTPATAALHFEKIECFCFQQQTIQPGETRTMPLVFFVNTKADRDLSELTLSYTIFEAPAAQAKAAPLKEQT